MLEKAKTVGWMSVMGGNQVSFSARGKTFILRRTMADGKMKEYEDDKREFVKLQVTLDDKREFLFYLQKVTIMDVPRERLKAIEVYSSENELLETVVIDFNQHMLIDPVYIFLSRGESIGEGTGNVAYYIAQKLLGEELDPRFVAGTKVDQSVIDELSKLGRHINVARFVPPEDPFEKVGGRG